MPTITDQKTLRLERKEKLKSLFKTAGLTQVDLANKLDLRINSIHYWVAGERIPKFENACRMSAVLQVSLEKLAEAMGFPCYKSSDAGEKARAIKKRSLDELIKLTGLSRKEFAAELGVANSTVDYWVAGKISPVFDNACAMSIVLQVSLAELFEALFGGGHD